MDGLSGDEVDPSLIIAGGRGSRRGRAQMSNPYAKAKPAANPYSSGNPYGASKGVISDSDDDF